MHLYSDNSKPACLLLLLASCCRPLAAAEGELPEAAGHKIDYEKEINTEKNNRKRSCQY